MAEPEMKKPGIMDGAGEWDESKHPRDIDGKFTNVGGGYRQNSSYEDILKDEMLPKSIGAKWANYDIRLPNDEVAHLAEGTYIRNKEVFAGKGTKTPIRQEESLIKDFGGKKGEWAKIKGQATLELDGKTFEAEIHWYEELSVGKVDIKYKDK